MKLLLSVLVLFLFYGCSDQSKKDTKKANSVEKKVVVVKKEVVKPKKEEVKKVLKKEQPKRAEVQKVITKTKEKVKEIAKTVVSVTQNKEVEKVTQKITKALDSISLSATQSPTVKATQKEASSNQANDIQNVATDLMAGFGSSATKPKKNSIDGVALFKSKCSSCHGVKAGKKALGKSEIIAKWDSKKILDALHGYKNGTFGGSMKAIMQGQAKGLSDDQISVLANIISKF
ncbi:MAG: c-type cytochrome [Sulfurospirillum sp.]